MGYVPLVKRLLFLMNVCTQAFWKGGGFRRYIFPGSGKPRRGPWISEGPNSFSHRRFFLFFYFFGGIFNYF